MPGESRFRLVRPFDIAEAFAQKRSDGVGILVDQPAVIERRTGIRRRMVNPATRAGRGLLPSWYPRIPLRDITAITRAIERRRARLAWENGETAEGQVQDAPLEHQVLTATPSNTDVNASS